MLQRQVMFKQMQEMQRRQQIQELGDTRNQTYANQLSSGGQFQPTINRTPIHDSSQMFMLHNMQMVQQNGSNAVQGLPNSFVLSQNQHHSLNPSLGFMQPQFGIPTQNIDKNLNQHPHFQGQSDISGNLLTHHSNFSSDQNDLQDIQFQPGQSIQEKNFLRQVPVQSLSSGNLSESYTNHGLTPLRDFSHVESKGTHDNTASLDPLEQKILFNTDDDSWGSFTKNCKMEIGGLESRGDHTSYMDEFPSMQSGSWSALMQSAVAESSSSDTGIQEEWSGLSLQNPEPSTENKPNFINSERPQNNWVDSHSPNVSMFPGFLQSGHQQKNCESSHFQSETFHATNQHSSRDVGQSNDHGSQQMHPIGRSQSIQSSLPSTSIWPGQEHANNNDNKPHNYFSGDVGNEKTGSLWLHENTSHQMAGSLQKQYDQANRLNSDNYSLESDKMAPSNVEHMSTFLGASSGFHGHKVTAQSEHVLDLFKRDVKSNDHTAPGVQLNLEVSALDELPPIENSPLTKSSNNTPLSGGFSFHVGPTDNQNPQPYSRFPSLSRANSSSTFLSSHNINDFIKNQGNMGTRSLSFSPAQSNAFSSPHESALLDNTSPSQHSVRTVIPKDGGFLIGSPSPWSNMTAQQDMPLQKPNEISNIFWPNDSATNTGAPNEPINQNLFSNECSVPESSKPLRQSEYSENLLKNGSSDHKGLTEMQNSTFLSGTTHGKQDSSRHRPELEAVRQAEPERGPNSSGVKNESKVDKFGKASSTAQLQNLQGTSMYAQSDTQNNSIGSNEASNATNQSLVSLQMAPSWFKQYGSLKEHHMLSISNPNATLNAAQQFSGMAQGESLEKSSNMQVNLANSCHGSNVLPLTTVPSIASELVLSSDVSNQKIVTSTPKKRKMVAFNTVPWYKEVNNDPSRFQIIGMAGLQWVHASNRIQEVKIEAETFEVAKFPVVRSKRRLIFATELMQQVFPPPPAAILRAEATNCDYIAHLTARLTLGDACSLTGQLPPDTNEVSTEKLQMSNRTSAIDFSKVVEIFVGRVKKIEHDLSRMEKSLSIVDIKVGTQDLEKFGIINRFAKFHSKAQQNTVDSAMGPKSYPKRYVIPHPMPRIVPEGIDCLSL